METLLLNNILYHYYEYPLEKEFEQVIVEQAPYIFGAQSIYIDIKKRIGNSIITIPDGYLIDFSFEADPKLYIIENEISSHDPYKHIGSQLLKFAISYKASGREIKTFLLNHLMQDATALKKVEAGLKKANYRNIDAFLEDIIFNKPVAAIVIIDKLNHELEEVLSQLTMKTDTIEFQTFMYGNQKIHKFSQFNADVKESTLGSNTKPDDLNTIVVPAQEEGFLEEFIKNQCWYAIRISAAMIDKLKYIAAYQVAPTSAITHYAEIASIQKYADTNKYIVKFKGAAKTIKHITLDKNKKGIAPQSPRYASFDKLIEANTISQVFE
jgi:hypothetical protein